MVKQSVLLMVNWMVAGKAAHGQQVHAMQMPAVSMPSMTTTVARPIGLVDVAYPFGDAGGRKKSNREGLHRGLAQNLHFKPKVVR